MESKELNGIEEMESFCEQHGLDYELDRRGDFWLFDFEYNEGVAMPVVAGYIDCHLSAIHVPKKIRQAAFGRLIKEQLQDLAKANPLHFNFQDSGATITFD